MHLLNGTPLIQKTSRDKHGAQQNEKVIIFCYPRVVTTDLHDTGWGKDHFSLPTQGHNWPSWHRMRKWSFFITHAGSKLTFMTQDEKVIIFRYPRGVTTDLYDKGWESDHFSLHTRGHNWPFRCLDFYLNSFRKRRPFCAVSFAEEQVQVFERECFCWGLARIFLLGGFANDIVD